MKGVTIMALEDKLNQVKGVVKENAGKLTDDKQMQAEGAVENTVAKEIGRASCRERVSSPV